MSYLLMPSAEDVIDQPAKVQCETFLDQHRVALSGCLDGLTEEQARRALVPSKTTLLGLVKHAARACPALWTRGHPSRAAPAQLTGRPTRSPTPRPGLGRPSTSRGPSPGSAKVGSFCGSADTRGKGTVKQWLPLLPGRPATRRGDRREDVWTPDKTSYTNLGQSHVDEPDQKAHSGAKAPAWPGTSATPRPTPAGIWVD
jgi:hypothetical protein